jgi:hypothetical protein
MLWARSRRAIPLIFLYALLLASRFRPHVHGYLVITGKHFISPTLRLRGGRLHSDAEPRRGSASAGELDTCGEGKLNFERFPARALVCILPFGTQLANGLRHLVSCFILAKMSNRELRLGEEKECCRDLCCGRRTELNAAQTQLCPCVVCFFRSFSRGAAYGPLDHATQKGMPPSSAKLQTAVTPLKMAESSWSRSMNGRISARFYQRTRRINMS